MEAARRSDDRQENFLVGQRVFAKIKGYQAWPAMVTSVGVRGAANTLSSSMELNKLERYRGRRCGCTINPMPRGSAQTKRRDEPTS